MEAHGEAAHIGVEKRSAMSAIKAKQSLRVTAALLEVLGVPKQVGLSAEECVARLMDVELFIAKSTDKTKLQWMETRIQEVSQYHCTACLEIFQFASDKNGTVEPPVACPMCGRAKK